jgi:hypothetical protein
VPLFKIGKIMSEIFDTVNSFIKRMLEWEVEFHKKRRSEEYLNDENVRAQFDDIARKKLTEIFSEHLSKKALKKLAQARLDTLGTAQPPEYEQLINAESEKFDSTSGFIEAISQKGFKQQYRYSVTTEDDSIKIDSVSVWRPSSGKWEVRHSI